MTAAFLFGLIALAAVLANLAIRDHRRALASRRALLDPCRGVLGNECWSAGGDGFPTLDGARAGRAVTVALIPDTMVMRRLPQLWLSVTLKDRAPGAPSLSILARHRGNEFYAVTMDLPLRLEPPAGLPADIVVRGDGAAAQALCVDLVPVLARLLADVKVKEITLTSNGVRITRQAAEGRRGEHLLLRQAVFDEAQVSPAELDQMLQDLDALAAMRTRSQKAHAA